MSMLSYRELLSSLDEFEGTTIDGMSLLFAIGWLRSLANILAFMLTLPEIDQDTTILQLKHHMLITLAMANELPTEQNLVD